MSNAITIPQGQTEILRYTILNTAVEPPAPLDLTDLTVLGFLGWTQKQQLVTLEIGDGIEIDDPTTGELVATLRGEDTNQVSSRLGRKYAFELWVLDGDGKNELVDRIEVTIVDSWISELS